MRISFATRKLSKELSTSVAREKNYGTKCGRTIGRRLDAINAAANLEGLRYAPGKFHALFHDRKGQFACHLEEPLRLIFQPDHDPLPLNAAGEIIWSQVTQVEILEIEDYHKKK